MDSGYTVSFPPFFLAWVHSSLLIALHHHSTRSVNNECAEKKRVDSGYTFSSPLFFAWVRSPFAHRSSPPPSAWVLEPWMTEEEEEET